MLKEKGCILFESHGTPIEDPEFYDYCVEFEKNGLVKVKEGKICDDGKCMRDFFIYKKLD